MTPHVEFTAGLMFMGIAIWGIVGALVGSLLKRRQPVHRG